MDGYDWRHRDWLPTSPRIRPDWRLRRAEYLLTTRSRLNRRIDDELIKRARTSLAKKFRCDASAPARGTTIQSVHELSRTNDSPLRWLVEAYLLTTLTFQEIGATLRLPPELVATYHDLAFDVRSRPKATDWLTCFAMGRDAHPSFERVWKTIARAGGPKLLEVAIAITTGSPFPLWIRDSFTKPRLDDAILRMRGKLTIGAMLARTREHWRALVALRRKLRRLVPIPKDNKGEARLQVMLSLLTKFAPSRSTPDENQPIREPEPVTFATTAPGDRSSLAEGAIEQEAPQHPAAEAVQHGRSRGNNEPVVAVDSRDKEEVHPDVVEFLTEDRQACGPLSFIHIELEEANWSAFADESEPRIATESVRI